MSQPSFLFFQVTFWTLILSYCTYQVNNQNCSSVIISIPSFQSIHIGAHSLWTAHMTWLMSINECTCVLLCDRRHLSGTVKSALTARFIHLCLPSCCYGHRAPLCLSRRGAARAPGKEARYKWWSWWAAVKWTKLLQQVAGNRGPAAALSSLKKKPPTTTKNISCNQPDLIYGNTLNKCWA